MKPIPHTHTRKHTHTRTHTHTHTPIITQDETDEKSDPSQPPPLTIVVPAGDVAMPTASASSPPRAGTTQSAASTPWSTYLGGSYDDLAELHPPPTMSQDAFEAAVAWVKDPAAVGEKPLKGVPTSRKLNLYKFYKQATEGDVQGGQPWAVQVTNRSKWDAWKTVEGTSAEDARQGYVDELAKQKEEFPRET